MYSVVPSQVLYDTRLAPYERVALLILFDREKSQSFKLDKESFRKEMEYNNSCPNLDTIELTLNKLVELNYLESKGDTYSFVTKTLETKKETKTRTKKEPKKHSQEAIEVMDYLSQSRISRGFSKKPLTSKSFLDTIDSRIKGGATKEECIRVINYAFIHDEWLRTNEKYLLPTTLFRASNFAKYLANSEQYEGLENFVVTEVGYDIEEEEGELWEV